MKTKILIIQLARFGDLLLLWPALRALRRQFPAAEIDLLVRDRFKGACTFMEEVDAIWTLPTSEVVEPLLSPAPDLAQSQRILESWVEKLKGKYSSVYNLSYSPFSSELTSQVTSSETNVVGYTRHSDQSLSLPDDVSAYFYAQVGPGKPNRLHLSTLFATALAVEVQESDWKLPPQLKDRTCDLLMGVQSPFVAVHIGGSQESKRWAPYKWNQFIRYLSERGEWPVVLLGSKDEINIARSVAAGHQETSVINLVGQTSFEDLFAVIGQAEVLVGCDSAPIHVASFVGTPCINLSFDSVNFWETGPRSDRSIVLYKEHPDSLPSDFVAQQCAAFLRQQELRSSHFEVTSGWAGYIWKGPDRPNGDDFLWELVQAIYMDRPWPQIDLAILEAMKQLLEVNEIALDQLQHLELKKDKKIHLDLLDRCDEITHQIEVACPFVGPLVRWFVTEKIRLGPGHFNDILLKTRALHQDFAKVLRLYTESEIDHGMEAANAEN